MDNWEKSAAALLREDRIEFSSPTMISPTRKSADALMTVMPRPVLLPFKPLQAGE